MNKNINLGGVSNIVNSTKDLEWFMTQFIRKYEEMAELQDVACIDEEVEDLKLELEMYHAEDRVNRERLDTLEGKYR